MYTISDIMEMGTARDQISSTIKDVDITDDTDPISMSSEETFE